MKTNIWYISCCPYINFLKHTVSKSILPSINFHKKIWKDSWRDQSGSYFGNFPNDLWPPPRFWRKSNSSQLFFIFFFQKRNRSNFCHRKLEWSSFQDLKKAILLAIFAAGAGGVMHSNESQFISQLALDAAGMWRKKWLTQEIKKCEKSFFLLWRCKLFDTFNFTPKSNFLESKIG